MSAKRGLDDILTRMEQESTGETIAIGDIVRALQKRGFGALLMAPSLIIALPTGAIPGVPAICALFILLVAGQLIVGADHPWLPRRLRDFSFPRTVFRKSVEKIRPYARWVDNFFQPRYEFLTRNGVQRAIAVLCIALSVFIIVLGFIPFAPILPALAILLFGLALSVHDGLLTVIGLILVGAAGAVMPLLMQ